MARPVAADSVATRRRILAGASALFSERGPGDVSVRDIAAHSGISLATVHHYFGTKEQLYDACIEAMNEEMESLRAELEPAFRHGGAFEDLLERTVRASFRFACAHRGAVRLSMRTIIDRGGLEPERRARVHLPFLERSAATLAAFLGGDRAELRLAVQSVMHLAVRYALTSPEELALITGVEDEEEALALVEDHLADVAGRLVKKPKKKEKEKDR